MVENNSNITLYYSKFNLFDESKNFIFIKYQIFEKYVKKQLGTKKNFFDFFFFNFKTK